jgi:hypothetical protein
VLARPLPRFAVIQLVSQLLGALGMLLVGQQLSWPWVPVIAAVAALTLVLVWLPRLGAREELRPSQVERLLDKATSRRWGED